MRTRWSAKRFMGVAAICVSFAALAVGSMPSAGFAFGDGSTSGGVTNGGTTTGGGTSSAGSTTTASGRNTSRFYDAGINGTSCTGVGGTVGGSHGTARSTVGTPSTVTIKVRRLSPTAIYNVIFEDGSVPCNQHAIGTLTTDAHGRGSGTYTFSATPYTGTGNFLVFGAPTDQYQTPEISF
jgi:hypothetical protein